MTYIANGNIRYQLRVKASNKNQKSTKHLADLQEERLGLLNQIHNWRQAQLVYTPYAAVLVASSSAVNGDGVTCTVSAENTPLFLPSALPVNIQSASDMKRVCHMEIRLRLAEARDALTDIRRMRRSIQWLWQFKKVNLAGMGNRPNTKSQTIYNRMSNQVDRAANKYRRARSALLILDPDGAWQGELRELRKEDIRGPGKGPDEEKKSNGRFEPSWIWLTVRAAKSTTPTEHEFNESMRVEWAKQRARMMRWQEESMIVQEEMRRVLVWFEWKADWWEGQALLRKDGDPDILHGVASYAHKQAYIIRRLAVRCASEWMPVLRENNIEPCWGKGFENVEKPDDENEEVTGMEDESEDTVESEWKGIGDDDDDDYDDLDFDD